MTIAELRAALNDCGDTLPVVVNGHQIASLQLQGVAEGRVVNLVTDPTQFVPELETTTTLPVEDQALSGLTASNPTALDLDQD